jgi:hypothetical protein
VENKLIRLFIQPKSWRAKGNLEFEELLLLSLHQPEMAEPEIRKRLSLTSASYLSAIKAQITMVSILTQLTGALLVLFERHYVLLGCTDAVLLSVIIILLIQVSKRAEILWNNMNDCYSWLLNEILHPTEYELSPEMKSAFIVFCKKADHQLIKRDKKFRRIIRGFGYTITTIEN